MARSTGRSLFDERAHHESDEEFYGRRQSMAHTGTSEAFPPLPREKQVTLKVSIPVRIAGYTGQREQWEDHERDFYVALDGDRVLLKDGTGIPGQCISFPLDGLQAAVEILKDYGRR